MSRTINKLKMNHIPAVVEEDQLGKAPHYYEDEPYFVPVHEEVHEEDDDEPIVGSINVGNKTLSMKRGANQFNPNDYSNEVSKADKKMYEGVDDTKKVTSKLTKRKKFKKKEVYCEDCDQCVLVHPSTHLSIVEDEVGNQSKVYRCPEHKVGTCQNSRKSRNR